MMAGPLRIKAQPVHAQVECDNVIGGRGKGCSGGSSNSSSSRRVGR